MELHRSDGIRPWNLWKNGGEEGMRTPYSVKLQNSLSVHKYAKLQFLEKQQVGNESLQNGVHEDRIRSFRSLKTADDSNMYEPYRNIQLQIAVN